MLEERYLIEHCSPTLASIKTGSLFRISYTSDDNLLHQLSCWNAKLSPKGVLITTLKKEKNMALVYVYRKQQLNNDLKRKGVSVFLQRYGYRSFSANEAICHLKKRFLSTCSFPHEIGLFLGYPLEDVIGFIENGGKNCKYCGYWKVYSDEQEAEKIFARFRKCRNVYMRLFNEGKTVLQLTVAA